MVNATKVTKVDIFKAMIGHFEELELETVAIKGEDVSLVDFCNHEIELIQGKAEKAKARKTVDNSQYFELVEKALEGGALTPTELMAKIGVANTQKVASIVKGMSNITKNIKGKKVFYSLAR